MNSTKHSTIFFFLHVNQILIDFKLKFDINNIKNRRKKKINIFFLSPDFNTVSNFMKHKPLNNRETNIETNKKVYTIIDKYEQLLDILTINS